MVWFISDLYGLFNRLWNVTILAENHLSILNIFWKHFRQPTVNILQLRGLYFIPICSLVLNP